MKDMLKKFFSKHAMFKVVGIIALIGIILTWIIPYGYYSEGLYNEYGMNRIGLNDIPTLAYYSVYFCIDKILYLLVVAGFYGVLVKNSGYKKIVTTVAKKLKGKEIITVLSASLIVGLMASITSQVFAVLLFIPFIISVILNMKLDKMTAFLATFGSLLVGILGATYGTEGLYWFNYYLGASIGDTILVRWGIFALAFVVYSFFTIKHVKKVLAGKKIDESKEDNFVVEAETKKSVKVLPISIILGLISIITILGFVSWSGSFNVTVFDTFHTWLTGLKVGADYTVISYIIGSTAKAFGSWDLFTLTTILAISSLVIAFISGLKLDGFLTEFTAGAKKMVKPIAFLVLVYFVFVIVYYSPIMPTITNALMDTSFSPLVTALTAFITSIFQSDLGYTGYVIGSFFTTTYTGSDLNAVAVIYTTVYGFLQLFVPTSAVLLIGLSFMNIEYKTWLKHIWRFLAGMLVALLIIFLLLA